MSQPAAVAHAPHIAAAPNGRSELATLGRVTGVVGIATVVAVIGAFPAVGICAGLVMLRAPGLPRWVGWWDLVAGIGEVLARAWFPHGFAYAPFALYWAWVLVMSVLLLGGRVAARTDRPDADPT